MYVCTYENCNKSFCRPYKLQNHYNLHIGIRSFQCTVPNCKKSYSSSSHLQRHIKSSHTTDKPNEKIVYACTYKSCNATFETLWGLQRHESNHSSPFHCEKCDVHFRKSISLNKHLARHEVVSKRKCQYCGEDFSAKLKRDWLRHEKKHGYVKCDFCERVFQSVPLLQRHLVIHESQFECAHCGAVMRNKSSLREHITTLHLGLVSAYICKENNCSKVFHYKRNCSQHRVRHDVEAQYKCPIVNCGQNFIHKRYYLRHLKLHQQNRVKLKGKPQKVDVSQKLIDVICA